MLDNKEEEDNQLETNRYQTDVSVGSVKTCLRLATERQKERKKQPAKAERRAHVGVRLRFAPLFPVTFSAPRINKKEKKKKITDINTIKQADREK